MRHAVLSLTIVASLTTAIARAEYQLTSCNSGQGVVHLKFVAETGALRRITLGPKGVELSGDVKGVSRLDGVKELRVTATRELIYAPKNGPEVKFGRLTEECLTALKRIAEGLGIWKGG
jgi:hypothetical protein